MTEAAMEAALHQQLGRIEGKLDAFGAAIGRAHDRIDAVEKDVRGIERQLAKYAAYATIGATAGSSAIAYAARLLFAGGVS